MTEDLEPRPLVTTQGELASPPPYVPVLLGHDHVRGYAFTGVAVLIRANLRSRCAPELVAELSRALTADEGRS